MLDACIAVFRAQLNVGIAHENLGAESAQQLDDLCADISIADDADDHLVQLAARQVRAVEIAAPDASTQRFMAAADHAGFGEDRADGEFGDGGGVAARRVDDCDAARAGGASCRY